MSAPVPFPYLPNGAGHLSDSLEWVTDIRTSYSQKEQRAALRAAPGGSIEFSVPMFSAVRAAQVLGLLWAHHVDQWIVPLWKYGVRTLIDLNGGETEIPCSAPAPGYGLDTVPWQVTPSAANPYVLLWESDEHWQVLQYSAVIGQHGWGTDWDFSWGSSSPAVPDTLLVLDGVAGPGLGWGLGWGLSWGLSVAGGVAFRAGARVIPCRVGRLDPKLSTSLEALEAASGRYAWTIEEVGD